MNAEVILEELSFFYYLLQYSKLPVESIEIVDSEGDKLVIQ